MVSRMSEEPGAAPAQRPIGAPALVDAATVVLAGVVLAGAVVAVASLNQTLARCVLSGVLPGR